MSKSFIQPYTHPRKPSITQAATSSGSRPDWRNCSRDSAHPCHCVLLMTLLHSMVSVCTCRQWLEVNQSTIESDVRMKPSAFPRLRFGLGHDRGSLSPTKFSEINSKSATRSTTTPAHCASSAAAPQPSANGQRLPGRCWRRWRPSRAPGQNLASRKSKSVEQKLQLSRSSIQKLCRSYAPSSR